MRGEVLQVGNIPATIIGVAPEGFTGVSDGDPPAVFLPITTFAGAQADRGAATTYFTNYSWGWMEVMMRRKPGVTAEQASSDLSRAYVSSWNAQQATEASMAPASIAKPVAIAGAMKRGAGPEPGLEARTALWVTGVAAIVLLIACANVANLFLARTLKRQRETAVRLALGVRRGRLIRQAVTESLVLSILGSAAGLAVAQWGGLAIRRLLINDAGASLDVFTDWRTLGVAVGIALIAGLLTGLVPAAVSGRGDLARALKTGTREGTYHRSRTRTTLLVVQGALSVVLLVGAGLFVRSLDNVKSMRLGYDAEPVLLASRNMRGMQVEDSARARLARTLLTAAQAVPGVEHATWVSSVPFWSTSSMNLYYLPIEQHAPAGGFAVLVRMRGDAVAQQEIVRKALQAVMPGQSYVTVTPLRRLVSDAQRSWRLGATMFVAFGVLAVVVAGGGLCGVIGYNVTQRMHELGVRVALGAQSGDILRLVVGQGVRLAVAGVALGTLLAIAASRWLEPLLFEQSAMDPVIYGFVGAVLIWWRWWPAPHRRGER